MLQMLLNFVVLLLIILQKPCQNFKILILWLLSILQAVWKCAYSHELRAESHTSHIGHCYFYSILKFFLLNPGFMFGDHTLAGM